MLQTVLLVESAWSTSATCRMEASTVVARLAAVLAIGREFGHWSPLASEPAPAAVSVLGPTKAVDNREWLVGQ
jgi:hypothetical protein